MGKFQSWLFRSSKGKSSRMIDCRSTSFINLQVGQNFTLTFIRRTVMTSYSLGLGCGVRRQFTSSVYRSTPYSHVNSVPAWNKWLFLMPESPNASTMLTTDFCSWLLVTKCLLIPPWHVTLCNNRVQVECIPVHVTWRVPLGRTPSTVGIVSRPLGVSGALGRGDRRITLWYMKFIVFIYDGFMLYLSY